MNTNLIFILTSLFLIPQIYLKSQDYARHIELSLLFYECQRSGALPETNRIYWRHDSMLDAGADVGLDLTGGYYDAGDNVKFNFPGASSMTLIAWSGVEFSAAYKKIGQWNYLLDTVKWATDFYIKCHSGKDELYVQVGDGIIDHSFWYPPEYITYKYPSYKIDAEKPGSEVAAETAATLAAASILFKEEDSVYSANLLKHAIEIYDFADTYRSDYTNNVPGVVSFYASFSGYQDELAWGALWLYRATNDEKYLTKFETIADAEYVPHDMKKYPGFTGPISWDDKRPGCYILSSIITKNENRLQAAYEYCDAIIAGSRTAGGLWYDSGLSVWGSNRYAANAASMVAIFANFLDKNDSKKKTYIEFVKSQIDYMLGDNPAGVNYVVGAEDNSPKAVHHRGASGVFDSSDKSAKPSFNVYTLYGALAGGPNSNDEYIDERSNYQMNEVALDYNAGFTICLSALVEMGYGKKDENVDFERSWPQKAMKSDVRIKVENGNISVGTGSGLMCTGFCIMWGNEKVCNKREQNFLDGEGTMITVNANVGDTTEFEFLCDGYHIGYMNDPVYKPEFGHLYKVKVPGGPENTEALFEESECWPAHIC